MPVAPEVNMHEHGEYATLEPRPGKVDGSIRKRAVTEPRASIRYTNRGIRNNPVT